MDFAFLMNSYVITRPKFIHSDSDCYSIHLHRAHNIASIERFFCVHGEILGMLLYIYAKSVSYDRHTPNDHREISTTFFADNFNIQEICYV